MDRPAPAEFPRGVDLVRVAGVKRERGMSLIELLAVLALASVVLSAVGIGSFVWIRDQASRSAVYHVQALLQSARAEAAVRNRACRFLLDRNARSVEIVDLNDPGDPNDDVALSRLILSPASRFERPDSGDAITLPVVGGSLHEAVFEADGVVSSGAGGEIVLWGGRTYHRVTLFGAGGVRVQRWNGSSWASGS